MKGDTDYQVENHGSIFLVRPLNEGAMSHLQEHTEGMWFGNALVVEPRYARDLVGHLLEDGFSVV